MKLFFPNILLSSNLKMLLVLMVLSSFVSQIMAQNAADAKAINNALAEKVVSEELMKSDVDEWLITHQHVSRTSRLHHIYFRQVHNGIEVHGANSSIHLGVDGSLFRFNDGFVKDLESKITGSNQPGFGILEAVGSAAQQMGYDIKGEFQILEETGTHAYNISKAGVSLDDIPAKLVYTNHNGQYVLAWNFSIHELDGLNWWEFRVDASTGAILNKNNWVVSCDFGSSESNLEDHGTDHSNHNHYLKPAPGEKEENMMPMVGAYNVFALPLQSPLYGPRSIVTNPDDPIASPFGWHDTNGVPGSEFFDTRGNNVDAFEAGDNFGFRPNGGGALNFNFPWSMTWSNANQSESAVITNLFYWSNLCHDITYLYGFDEASGNFQVNNYGNGGFGGDPVLSRSQGGQTCNAFFGTPPDGSSGTMFNFICGTRDGSVDNMVIIHEYAHGISNRLTGGGNNVGCLNNNEQMGEGWSDYYGIVYTMQAGHTATTNRTAGNYLFGQSAAGPGIRTFPYTTDMGVNPDTYNSIIGTFGPHRLGTVWCAMIWDMTWALIDKHGFDSDFYNGSGGNNVAIALVTEGMKLQPCNPGFVDGRDAILAADVALFNGENQCEIWTAFANRGLGQFANQGSPFTRNDGTEDFTIPPLACAPDDPTCDPPVVTCPPDMTAACHTDIVLDPFDATAIPQGTCTIEAQYIKNPYIEGVPGCDGTTYTYVYKALDSDGNVGECEQVWTIVNDPPDLTVPAGSVVNCYDDIIVDVSDATVTNACAEYNLYLTAPEVNGPMGCPGTQYIFTYRLVEACGRIVEATRTFTENNNPAPTIDAPGNLVVDCLGSINPNPNNAVVTTSCGAGYTVSVSGPVSSGPQDCPNTTYAYTYTVTDDCGRTASDVQVYTISNEAPSFVECPVAWFVLNCEDYGGESGTIEVIEAWIASFEAYSACGVQLQVNNNFNPNNINTCLNNGINTINFSATDNCGRTSTCQATYVVVDTEAPEFYALPQDHWEICNFNSQANLEAWVANRAGALASDGCSNSNVSWQASPANPQINCVGSDEPQSVEVTFIVTDNCGNKTSETATFTTLPPPEIGNGNASSQFTSNTNGITLLQNRPNPFKNETLIGFNLVEAGPAILTIYDVNGKVLKVVEGEFIQGLNEVSINRSDLNSSGVLFYTLTSRNETATRTMILMD